jgi:hypothetical protein
MMYEVNQSIAHIVMPPRIARLPISQTGYPVPWFVARIDGVPDFRVVDTPKLMRAHRGSLCWICGEPLGKFRCFLVGPMCTITRTVPEPPAHRDCCEYAVRACPFLSKPNMRRNEHDMPAGHEEPAGIMIRRNPGVTALWVCRDYKPFRDGRGKVLFHMGTPVEVIWYRERRTATHDEIMESIDSGYPLLQAQCATAEDKVALEESREAAMQLVPA